MKKKLRKAANTEDIEYLSKVYKRSIAFGITYGQVRDIIFKLARSGKWKSLEFLLNNTKIRGKDEKLIKQAYFLRKTILP